MQGSPKGTSQDALLRRGAAIWVPGLAALVIMIPRLLSPEFGLFDDGVTLQTVRQLSQGNLTLWDLQVGRFRLAYWAYWLLPYLVGGEQPFWFFLLNTITLAATGILLSLAVKGLLGEDILAGIAGVLLVLSGPVIENFYTLSKAEPFQALCLVAMLYLLSRWVGTQRSSPSLGGLVAAGSLMMLASSAKETGPAVIPIAGAWFFAAALFNRSQSRDRHTARVFGQFFLAVSAGAAVYLAARFVLGSGPLYGQGYTERYVFSSPVVLTSAVRWAGWGLRFFPYLIPLGLLCVWQWRKFDARAKGILVGSLVWMSAWVLVYLPWTFMVGYFMLPFAVGAAVFSAPLVCQGVELLQRARSSERVLSCALLAAAGLGILIVQINNTSIARLQLLVDEANQAMLRVVASDLPREAKLIVNIQDPNEYLQEIRIYLEEIYDRSDIEVLHFTPGSQAVSARGSPARYYLVPVVEDQLDLSVRHGVIEEVAGRWNRLLIESLDEGAVTHTLIERRARLVDVSVPRALCPVLDSLGYCSSGAQVLRALEFRYGWEILTLDE